MAYGTSVADRLAAVRAAIDGALTAQSYSIAGRNKSMASIAALRQMEKELMEESTNSGGMCSLGIQMEASA